MVAKANHHTGPAQSRLHSLLVSLPAAERAGWTSTSRSEVSDWCLMAPGVHGASQSDAPQHLPSLPRQAAQAMQGANNAEGKLQELRTCMRSHLWHVRARPSGMGGIGDCGETVNVADSSSPIVWRCRVQSNLFGCFNGPAPAQSNWLHDSLLSSMIMTNGCCIHCVSG